jgi:hypothetical protein
MPIADAQSFSTGALLDGLQAANILLNECSKIATRETAGPGYRQLAAIEGGR